MIFFLRQHFYKRLNYSYNCCKYERNCYINACFYLFVGNATLTYFLYVINFPVDNVTLNIWAICTFTFEKLWNLIYKCLRSNCWWCCQVLVGKICVVGCVCAVVTKICFHVSSVAFTILSNFSTDSQQEVNNANKP